MRQYPDEPNEGGTGSTGNGYGIPAASTSRSVKNLLLVLAAVVVIGALAGMLLT